MNVQQSLAGTESQAIQNIRQLTTREGETIPLRDVLSSSTSHEFLEEFDSEALISRLEKS